MNGILKILIDIASTPAILVALIAILGLVLQRKHISEVLKGGIKTFVGFLVLTAGAGVVTGSLTPFGKMFQQAFHVTGVVPNNEAIIAIAIKNFGTATALIMLFGMAANILFARITKFKYIYLTGHAFFYQACIIAVILTTTGMNNVLMIVVGGLFLGMCGAVFPAIVQPFTKQITGTDDVALAHTGNFGYMIAGYIGKWFGNKKKSTEDINFPKGLSFLRDSTVSIALTMMVVYLIVAIFTGPTYIETKLSSGTNFIVFSLQQAGTFAAGVYVILAGVRMILAEIIPAFKGISERLVPNSKPGLDCPIVFPYAPNAVLIGFFSSFVGGIVSLIIMAMAGTTIVIPGVVPHFFCGATSAVYGNATGGIRGAVLGSFVQGIVISFMPLFLMPLVSNLGFTGSTFSDTDYGIIGLLLGQSSRMGGQIAVIAVVVIVGIAMFALTAISGKKKNKDEEPA
ncbi:PTS ascorbate transporter subunit IIC [Lacticaseibacillus paracasei]|uniref:Ascorbate-specific PTS system EIIC component n=1 Tax=Lacticaseibacillus paracasei subsp. paracasei Lpp126 TaxID=1256206 RepID=S2R710_LACPA|nr:PTS ascorbate transporter subunit IIC [Lacticaseibacillus paracasei]EPC74052.1 PTS system ascorbate-specific transporter subunit IIC [Lacticaseibacillus paracasei subsp. paracasei Lpp126]WCZ18214.1 PTS ascorbate transporter subunit IIC [Lacticaseibacillus paracasei]